MDFKKFFQKSSLTPPVSKKKFSGFFNKKKRQVHKITSSRCIGHISCYKEQARILRTWCKVFKKTAIKQALKIHTYLYEKVRVFFIFFLC